MLSEMQRFLRWNGGQICMAQLDVESPFRFSSFILFIDSLLHHTAAIQKSDGAKKTPKPVPQFPDLYWSPKILCCAFPNRSSALMSFFRPQISNLITNKIPILGMLECTLQCKS